MSSSASEVVQGEVSHAPAMRKSRVRRVIPFGLSVLTNARYRFRRWKNKLLEGRKNRRLLAEARRELGMSENPLVTVRIATYQNSKLLIERTLPTILSQTYQNFEIVIVGDGCTSEHVQRIESWLRDRNDQRILFLNLPQRGVYPSDPMRRWMVAGVPPANKGIDLAKGEWLAPLDDDDEFTPDHIEALLRFAQKNGFEFVYGVTLMEQADGGWQEIGSAPLAHAQVCHQSVLYHKRLGFMKYDINSWKYWEPADWNMWRRMQEAGARIGFLPKVVASHYREKRGLERSGSVAPPKCR